jgi:hypothetical protein
MTIRVVPVSGRAAAADWLRLVRRVYPDWRFRGGQPRAEAALLSGRHAISNGLDLHPLLAVDRHGLAVGRCAVSFREGAPAAQLGFLECLDLAAAPALFAAAEDLAAEKGRTTIRGPFDPDYWVGYRLKIDHFDVPPFLGEPYNRSEYPKAWEAAGYQVVERYQSSVMARPQVPGGGPWDQAELRARTEAAGVEVRPVGGRFAAVLRPIYGLVMDRFAVMPDFHRLEFDRFAALMRPLGLVVDRRASQLAWSGDRLIGFSAVVPDFGRRLASGLPRAVATVATRLPRPSALIAAYLAVDSAYRGLGPALMLPALRRAAARRVAAVGALIHEGAPTASYLKDQITRVHHYALYQKALT